MTVGLLCLLPPLSFGSARVTSLLLRFHVPLIESDVQVSRIRLSDKTSRLRPRSATLQDATAGRLCLGQRAVLAVQLLLQFVVSALQLAQRPTGLALLEGVGWRGSSGGT